MADNSSPFRLFWADIDDAESAKAASRLAIWAVAIVCAINLGVVTYQRLNGNPLILHYEALAYLEAALYLALLPFIWFMSRIAALLALGIFLAGNITTYLTTHTVPVSILSVGLALFLISGVRGTVLFHKFANCAPSANGAPTANGAGDQHVFERTRHE